MDIKKVISIIVLFSLMLIIPSAMAIKTFHVQETDLVTISPEALDPDHDQVTYTYSPPLDAQGQWQTGYNDAGEYLLRIGASDGLNQTTKEVLLVVDNKNQRPYLTEKKIKVKELQLVDLKQFVADPDEDPLEYTFIKPFDKAGLWVPDYQDQGTFVAKFSVSDGEFTVPLRLEIEVLNTNQPPIITGSFAEEKTVSLQENEPFSFFMEAEDGDKDQLSYSWTLDGVAISDENHGEYFFDFEDAGKYELAVEVSDADHQVEKKWQLQVENVNRQPEVNLEPVTVEEGNVITLPLPEKDADGDMLTYTFDEKFDQDGRWQTTFDDAGKYKLAFWVSDGTENVKEKIDVIVLNVDRAPELSLSNDLEVREGETLSFVLNVSDPDGDEVMVSFENAPEDADFDSESKTFFWSPSYDYIKRRGGLLSNVLNALRLEQKLLRKKELSLEVKACSQELCSTFMVPVTVYNANRAPVLEVPSSLTVAESELLYLTPSSQDLDGDIVRYYFTEPLHKRKGQWETAYEDAGEYTIYVTATDGVNSQTLPVKVTVLQKNRQPTVLVPRDEYTLAEGEEFVLPVDAFDEDNDSVSMYVENLPAGAVFQNRTFTWNPAYSFAAQKEENSMLNEASFLGQKSASVGQQEQWISFIATDGEFEVNHPVKLVVKDVNQAPQIIKFSPAQPLTVAEDQPLLFSVDAFDSDGGNFTYTWTFEPGEEKITGSNAVERTFVNPGEKKVSVIVSDGLTEVRQDWLVTVSEEVVPVLDTVALEEPKFKVYVIEY